MDMIQKLTIALDTPEKLDRREIMSIHDLPEFTENRSFSIEDRNKDFVYDETPDLVETLKCPCCILRMQRALKRLQGKESFSYVKDPIQRLILEQEEVISRRITKLNEQPKEYLIKLIDHALCLPMTIELEDIELVATFSEFGGKFNNLLFQINSFSFHSYLREQALTNLKSQMCNIVNRKILKKIKERLELSNTDKTDKKTEFQDGLKEVKDVCDKLINSIDEIIKSLKS